MAIGTAAIATIHTAVDLFIFEDPAKQTMQPFFFEPVPFPFDGRPVMTLEVFSVEWDKARAKFEANGNVNSMRSSYGRVERRQVVEETQVMVIAAVDDTRSMRNESSRNVRVRESDMTLTKKKPIREPVVKQEARLMLSGGSPIQRKERSERLIKSEGKKPYKRLKKPLAQAEKDSEASEEDEYLVGLIESEDEENENDPRGYALTPDELMKWAYSPTTLDSFRVAFWFGVDEEGMGLTDQMKVLASYVWVPCGEVIVVHLHVTQYT